MKKSVWGMVMLGLLLSSCASLQKGSTSKASLYQGYTEDLSSGRISYPDFSEQAKQQEAPVPTASTAQAVDADLAFALNNVREKNKTERTWAGFTVLVFSGVDRDLAFKARNDLYTYFPDMKADMQYQQPRYLLKVGKFVNRIEAQAFYYQIKEFFPSARIMQDRFQREGYVIPDQTQDGERPNQVPSKRL